MKMLKNQGYSFPVGFKNEPREKKLFFRGG